MKAKRIVLSLLLALVFALCAFTLTACGGGGGGPEKVTIKYYLNHKAPPLSLRIDKNSTIRFATVPSREHCTFLGMYDEPVGGAQVVDKYGRSEYVASEEMTLWAYWEYADCTITLDVGEGTLPVGATATIGLKYEGEVPNLPLPTKEGYSFGGWYNNSTLVTDELGQLLSTKRTLNENTYTFNNPEDDENVILTAQWTQKAHTVKYDLNDGSEAQSFEVIHGDLIPEENIPVVEDKEDKIFMGWSTNGSILTEYDGGPVTQNLTFYAIWKSFKIIKFYEDINATEPTKEERVLQGEQITAYTPEREGCSFLGWHTSKALNDFVPTTTINYDSGNTEFYARWAFTVYTITFDTTCNDTEGTAVDNLTFTMNDDMFSLPTSSCENYTFIGWYDNAEFEGTAYTQIPKGTIGDIDLYAKWKGEDKTVKLIPGEGFLSSSNKTRTVEYGSTYTLPVPVYDGYVFMGYYTAEEDGVQITDGTGAGLAAWLTSDMETTLYAIYERKVLVTVNINLPEAGEVEVEEYYFEGAEMSFAATLNKGYEFIGWFAEDNETLLCGQKTYEFVLGAEDIELNLVYEANVYSVTFDVGDGAFAEDVFSGEYVEVTFGSEYTLPIPALEGFMFVGWMYNDEMICDKDGNGLSKWNIDKDVKLVAEYYEDDGTSLFIYSVETLLAMKEKPSAKYVLIRDIDLADTEWVPFDFSGTLIGNDHVIKNLTLTSDSGNLGMFYTLSGRIQDLTFRNHTVTSTSYTTVFVGGICAILTGTIDNVKVFGDVTGDYCRIGGFAGKVAGTISNSTNYVNVSSKTYEAAVSAGGFTGFFESGTLTNLENYGDVSIKNHVGGIAGWAYSQNMTYLTNHGKIVGGDCIGGIVGLFEKNGGYELIVNFKNDGEVEGVKHVGGGFGKLSNSYYHDGDGSARTVKLGKITNEGVIKGQTYVGGAVGHLYVVGSGDWNTDPSVIVTATDLVNSGDISGTTYVGGLVGYSYSDNGSSKIISCSSSAKITAEAYVGGLAGRLENVGLVSCTNTDSEVSATGYVVDGTNYYAFVGGFVGRGYYIEDCHNAVPIKYTNVGSFIGGIAGQIVNNTVKDSSNTADVTVTGNVAYVGGIAGEISCAGSYEIMNLSNSGKIAGKDKVGGIFGQIYNAYYNSDNGVECLLKVSKITNTADVEGASYVGGAMGYVYAHGSGDWNTDPSVVFQATEFSNTGDVTGTTYVGGLIGHATTDNGKSQLAQSTSTANVKAESYVGGLGGYFATVKLVSCSNENSTVEATLHYQDGTNFYAYVGGYLGRGYYIEDCHNAVTINYTGIGTYVGGIAGHINSTIVNSSNAAIVSAPSSVAVGGLVGSLAASGSYTTSGNTNNGNVIGKNSVGGLFGEIWNSYGNSDNAVTCDLNINKVVNNGNVTGVNYVGGLFGNVYTNGSGDWNTDPSVRIIGSEWTSSGAVVASYEPAEGESVLVGGLAGKIATDNGASALTIYTCTSSVNGSVVSKETLVGSASNFVINEI